jgi:hypothetical protein
MKTLRAIAALISALCISASVATAQESAIKPLSLTLAVSSNRFACIRQEECPIFDRGGIDRESNCLNHYRTQLHRPILYIATGTTLVKDSSGYPGDATITRRASVVVDALNLLGASYYAPSINDLALGLDEIATLRRKAHFKFLSANIGRTTAANSHELLFEPYDVRTWNGLPLVIIGLSGEVNRETYPVPRDVAVIPTEKALGSVFSKVDVQKKIVIVACSLDDPEIRRMVKAFPGIRFVAGGTGFGSSDLKFLSPTCLHVNPSPDGRMVSIVEIEPHLPFTRFFRAQNAWFGNDLSRTWADKLRQPSDSVVVDFGIEITKTWERKEVRSLGELRARGLSDEGLTDDDVIQGTLTGNPLAIGGLEGEKAR